jgi:CxxC-x17-CxxC domain-containing protein
MADYERSRGRRSPHPRSSRRNFDSGRGRGGLTMTKVNCSSCGGECEVPFKPTSGKPVFCSDCFRQQGKSGPNSRAPERNVPESSISERDLDVINEKLNKIMKALDIE